jgi:hypothetical protein
MEIQQDTNIDISSISSPQTTENKPKSITFYRIGNTFKWTDIPPEQRRKNKKKK